MTHLILFPYIMLRWKKYQICKTNSTFLIFRNNFLLYNPCCLADGKQIIRQGRGGHLILGHWSTRAVLEAAHWLCVCGFRTSSTLLLPYPHSAQVWQFSPSQCCLRFQLPASQHNYPFSVVLPPPGQHSRVLASPLLRKNSFPSLSFYPQTRWGYWRISWPTTSCGTLGTLLTCLCLDSIILRCRFPLQQIFIESLIFAKYCSG